MVCISHPCCQGKICGTIWVWVKIIATLLVHWCPSFDPHPVDHRKVTHANDSGDLYYLHKMMHSAHDAAIKAICGLGVSSESLLRFFCVFNFFLLLLIGVAQQNSLSRTAGLLWVVTLLSVVNPHADPRGQASRYHVWLRFLEHSLVGPCVHTVLRARERERVSLM